MNKSNYIPHGYVGLKFRDGKFVALLAPGSHMLAGVNRKVKVYIVRHRQPWIELPEPELRQLRDSKLLKGIASFVDLDKTQRAKVWLDGWYYGILEPGLYGYWTTLVHVRIEILEKRALRAFPKFAERASPQFLVGEKRRLAETPVKLT